MNYLDEGRRVKMRRIESAIRPVNGNGAITTEIDIIIVYWISVLDSLQETDTLGHDSECLRIIQLMILDADGYLHVFWRGWKWADVGRHADHQ